MRKDELKAVFDQQAADYDKKWAKMSPIRNGLHFPLESIFAELPADARVLCVGVGTGAELAHLAQKYPCWRFTALEPSRAMLDVCRNTRNELATYGPALHQLISESMPASHIPLCEGAQ